MRRLHPAWWMVCVSLMTGFAALSCGDDDPAATGGAGGTGVGGQGGDIGQGGCANTQEDPANCGACGNVCAPGEICQAGACVCNGDTQSDPANCGACNNRCAPGQTCQTGVCTCSGDTASLSVDVQPILTTSCAKNLCHTGSAPKAGLDLTAGSSFAELVGTNSGTCQPTRSLVVPGEPSESYLIDKLLGVELCGVGGRMPPGASGLTTDQIQLIANWICAGAPND